jgi:hypothetical protein
MDDHIVGEPPIDHLLADGIQVMARHGYIAMSSPYRFKHHLLRTRYAGHIGQLRACSWLIRGSLVAGRRLFLCIDGRTLAVWCPPGNQTLGGLSLYRPSRGWTVVGVCPPARAQGIESEECFVSHNFCHPAGTVMSGKDDDQPFDNIGYKVLTQTTQCRVENMASGCLDALSWPFSRLFPISCNMLTLTY